MTGGYILIFIFSCVAMSFAGSWTVNALARIAKYSHWREFTVAFFTISLGAVAPELFIGVLSAFQGVPELSLGNIIGQNIILLTLSVALSVFILKDPLEIESKTVKTSGTFAAIAAVLPLLLALDGNLSRIDGIILIIAFLFFLFWLLKDEGRFTRIYGEKDTAIQKRSMRIVLTDALIVAGGLAMIIFSAYGLIKASLSFALALGISIPAVGVIIVAAGTGLPETYFSLKLAWRNYSRMIIGGLMGSVIISSTLVLGIVTLIQPIQITDFSVLAVSRFFLIVSAFAFLIFMRTKSHITKKEAGILLVIYGAFVVSLLLF